MAITPTIGIIVALSREMELLKAHLTASTSSNIAGIEFIGGELGGKQVIVAQSGIGKVNSTICAVEMINNFSPRAIINTGVAGGLDTSLAIMDVVAATHTTYNDAWCGDGNVWGQIQGLPARFEGDAAMIEAAQTIETQSKLHCGLICSGDRFITSRTELNAIKEAFPEVLATDMESNSIGQTCYRYGVPFLSLRMISDTPGVEDHTAQYENFWEIAPTRSFEIVAQLIEKI